MAVSAVSQQDRRGVARIRALLERVGITLDAHLDYTCAIYDDEGEPIATGSAFGPTLRCFAVDPDHQGEGLLNEIISHLMDYQAGRGMTHLFVYTKPASARFFCDLGFYEIARVPGSLVFLENRRRGFADYLAALARTARPGSACAIVMNANPFTLGHRYLIEQAAASFDTVHLFLLSEDAGPIPARVRLELARRGTADLAGVVCHESGDYLISKATFPSYFLKNEDTVIRAQAALDTAIFAKIAQALGVTCRVVGEEPTSHVTGIYNEIMAKTLPQHGVACRIIPRKALPDGRVISASQVRQAIHDGRLGDVADMLPDTTLSYFRSAESEQVRAAIRREEDVIHY